MDESLLSADAEACLMRSEGAAASSLLRNGTCRSAKEVHHIIRKELQPKFAELRACESTSELLANPVYQRLEPFVRIVLDTPESANFSDWIAPPRSRYRFVAWNLERGIELDRQIEALRSNPYLRGADVLLLTEVDVGMARSQNRAVAQEIARNLGMHYAFVPCYLNLSKGAGLEYHAEGDNKLGLHGNAILSRYPLRDVRAIFLKNGIDKMKGREKRLGRQAAVVAKIEFPNLTLTAVCSHLDANSSQRHRAQQMRDILDRLGSGSPVVLGGDWNTTTYNSSDPTHAIAGFWLRVFMGVDNVIHNHYLHPYHRFEKALFRSLERRGFDYRSCNVLGERTGGYDAACAKTRQNLGEWVPNWCFAFMRWALRNHGGRCPIKIDWFATRGVRAERPVVLHEFRECEAPLSDHDPIGVDVVAH
jgi:endonuclease/exonuclease/phosphatase family metal-dependent hydrolase